MTHGLTLIPAWISNYIHYIVWDEITYSFLIFFNGVIVEVYEWISNFTPHITGHVITYPLATCHHFVDTTTAVDTRELSLQNYMSDVYCKFSGINDHVKMALHSLYLFF